MGWKPALLLLTLVSLELGFVVSFRPRHREDSGLGPGAGLPTQWMPRASSTEDVTTTTDDGGFESSRPGVLGKHNDQGGGGSSHGWQDDEPHRRQLKQISLIDEGETAPWDRFPYAVALLDKSNNQVCGGVLINPHWILTAAHCLDKHAKVDGIPLGLKPQIKLGTSKISDPVCKRGVEVMLGTAEIHPKWNGKFKDGHDIALLELSSPSSITPIALPARDTIFFDGEPMVAMGWGKQGKGRGKSDMLKWGNLRYRDNEDCNKYWWNGIIKKEMMCTEGRVWFEHADVCKGDSGGPLIEANRPQGNVEEGIPDLDVLVGIISFRNISCDAEPIELELRKPAVHTRVSEYIDWIERTMNLKENEEGEKGEDTVPGIWTRCEDDLDYSLTTAARNGELEKVKELLACGADVDFVGLFGWTALIEASICGHADIVKLLVDEGANPDTQAKSGQTALMYATSNGHPKIVEILVSAGADVEARNNLGRRARNLICTETKASCTSEDKRKMKKLLQ